MKNTTLALKKPIVFLIMLLCAAMSCLQTGHAATITVTSTADSGPNTLRQALADAMDGDTIDFNLTYPATIALTTGELVVNRSVTISGPGADQLTVQRSTAAGTPLLLLVFLTAPGKTVTIDSLTITNGKSGNGGGILNQATLTLSNCTVSGNVAANGAGIYNNFQATMTLSNCTVSGNSAGAGGGIYNEGRMTLNNCTISGNSAVAGGGGILNVFGTLNVNSSTIKGNTGGDSGGGILIEGGTLTITSSTLSGNSANVGGGLESFNTFGIFSTVAISNSTFSENSAGIGGGIDNFSNASSGTLTITSSTLSGNSANSGGAISNTDDAGVASRPMVTIGNTILNAGASSENIYNGLGTVTSLGYNLSSDAAGGDATTGPGGFLNQTGDIRNTDPMLGPLQDNGGPTFTHELLTGSPAIDKGKNFTAATTDQRGSGFDRTVDDPLIANATGGDGTDIGAFEVQVTAYAAQIQQPINANGTSVFNVRRGVVPVKFTLTEDGVATCALPPATIALTRTAGGTTGQIDESVYTGSADTGSNFRISSCQYMYNLSASALGVGTYRVDILIDGQVVGSASFQLK